MITRRQFLSLAGVACGLAAWHLLPLIGRGDVTAVSDPQPDGGLPTPFTIPIPIGRDPHRRHYFPIAGREV